MEVDDRCMCITLRNIVSTCILGSLLLFLRPVEAEGDLVVLGASVLSGARDSKEDDYMLHLQAMYEMEAKNGFSATFGASVLVDNDKGYVLLDSGVRTNFSAPLAPFLGVGFFMSDAEYLEECPSDKQSDTCDKTAVYGIYPEAGFHLWIGTQMRLSFFARAYLSNIRRLHDQNSVYGINLAFTLR